MKTVFVLLSTFLAFTSSQTTTGFNYAKSGSDWTGTCSTGSNQSPVDLDSTSGTCDSTMVFDVSFSSSVSTVLTNTGTTIQGLGNFGTLFATDVNGILTGYTATAMQVRSPAEHTIQGNSYDLEIQFIFSINNDFALKKQTTMTSAIVSVLFSASPSNSNNAFIDALTVGTNLTLDANTLLGSKLPSPTPYYTYQGSFTTPACTETVNWYVISSIQQMTSAELSVFNNLWSSNAGFASGNGNNRAIQSVSGRTIKKGGVQCEEQFVYFFSFFILYIFINYFIFKLL